MTYTEDDLLPLSGLQHLLYCERQCALIHVEQAWVENRFTAEGRIMHERVHEEGTASRGKIRVSYSMPLRSLELGLIGKADVVEFHRADDGEKPLWRPFPVEYKRGRPKASDWDRVQLCAQAVCLEEMLGVRIEAGALFYGKTRRREDVVFDSDLRRMTAETAKRFHDLVESGVTPGAGYSKKCDHCSFLPLCLPKTVEKKGRAVGHYFRRMLESR